MIHLSRAMACLRLMGAMSSSLFDCEYLFDLEGIFFQLEEERKGGIIRVQDKMLFLPQQWGSLFSFLFFFFGPGPSIRSLLFFSGLPFISSSRPVVFSYNQGGRIHPLDCFFNQIHDCLPVLWLAPHTPLTVPLRFTCVFVACA